MSRKKAERRNIWPLLRFAVLTLATVVGVFGAGWAAWQVQQTIVSDARFRFAPDGMVTEQALDLTGVHNSSRAAILRVFADDREQSIARIDLGVRRRQLQQIEWVREAVVRRIWPNRLAVDITGRTPVAFVQVPAGISRSFENPVEYVPALIDDQGVILRTRIPAQLGLPLLTGVRARDSVDQRRDRVQRMRRLMGALGAYGKSVEEVDVSDPDNLRVQYNLGDKEVVLILGDERFKERLELFLKHYPGISDKVIPGRVLDISIEGRVVER